MPDIRIVQSAPEDAYSVSLQIPEFDPWYPWSRWEQHLQGKAVIALVAFVGDISAGFKVGYHASDHFYSWIGGVVPDYRRMGVATLLADVQEALVRASGTRVIRMKTRNRFREMLHFAVKQGFYLTGVEQRGIVEDWRITLHKNV